MEALELEIAQCSFRVTSELPGVLESLVAAWEPALRGTLPGARSVHVHRDATVSVDGVPWTGALDVYDPAPRVERFFFDVLLAHHRHATAVHAGAVVLDGRLVLLVGSSGAGKSSTTRELLRLGAAYLTDDLLLVGSDSVTGVARTVQFDELPLDAPVPSYLTDCDVTSYQSCLGREKASRVPLWRGKFRTISEYPLEQGPRPCVVELVRSERDSLQEAPHFERLRLLHSAALTTLHPYRGQLGVGPTFRASWRDPENLVRLLVERLSA